MHLRNNVPALAVTALLSINSLAALAADEATTGTEERKFSPWEKGSLTLGGCMAALDSSVSFGTEGAGVTISPEKVLDLDSTLAVFRIGALYRPGHSRRHQLDFVYAGYDRSGSGGLSQDITIDGITYPVGAQIQSHLNFAIIRGTYSYAILQDDRMRIALGLSVYAVPLDYGLNISTAQGYSSVGGGNVTLPLPALALRSEFQLLPKLFLNASLDAMYFKYGGFEGSLMDANFGLEWRFTKHFGLGLNYNPLTANFEAQGSSSDYPGADFLGTVKIRYNALMLYGKVWF